MQETNFILRRESARRTEFIGAFGTLEYASIAACAMSRESTATFVVYETIEPNVVNIRCEYCRGFAASGTNNSVCRIGGVA